MVDEVDVSISSDVNHLGTIVLLFILFLTRIIGIEAKDQKGQITMGQAKSRKAQLGPAYGTQTSAPVAVLDEPHVAMWRTDWYKVIEDMRHCATFILQDELLELMTGGLAIVEMTHDLKPQDKTEWEHIISLVKRVDIAVISTFSMQQQIALVDQAKKNLLSGVQRMVTLMDRIEGQVAA